MPGILGVFAYVKKRGGVFVPLCPRLSMSVTKYPKFLAMEQLYFSYFGTNLLCSAFLSPLLLIISSFKLLHFTMYVINACF